MRSAMTWVVVVYCGYATEWNIILMGLLARRPATGSFEWSFNEFPIHNKYGSKLQSLFAS